jgi:hypothetical protein
MSTESGANSFSLGGSSNINTIGNNNGGHHGGDSRNVNNSEHNNYTYGSNNR